MELNYEDLTPYQSFVLAQFRAGNKCNEVVLGILDDLQYVLKLDTENRVLQDVGEFHKTGKLEIAGFTYLVNKPAPGFKGRTRINVENHYAVVVRFRNFAAVHLSEPQRYPALLAHLDQTTLPTLGKLEPCDPQLLHAAFVNGPTKALWMAGIQRQTTLKPDSKALNGDNLRYALDPLLDQSYYMSAVRSQVRIGSEITAVGVTPFKSRIWLSVSKDWNAWTKATTAVLDHLTSTKIENVDPLPFLAHPSELEELGDAFEMAVLPPELDLESVTMPPAELQSLETWRENTSFTITSTKRNEIRANVLYRGQELGQVEFRLQKRAGAQIAVETDTSSTDLRLKRLLRHCREDQWLKIWFASGDTLAHNRIFRAQLLDYPFERFSWDPFAGYAVTREKPTNLAAIGAQDSLFCWTFKTWSRKSDVSWLLCDDGAMELADFIHLDGRVLTLIHEKASETSSVNRGLSVSSFEVLISQALKGLRNLHSVHLHDGLLRGIKKKVAAATWHNGAPVKREQFLADLKALGSNYQRRLVIVQPQLTTVNLEKARTSANPHESMRYKQLMNLLHAAQAAARSLGAEITVIGHQLEADIRVPASLLNSASSYSPLTV